MTGCCVGFASVRPPVLQAYAAMIPNVLPWAKRKARNFKRGVGKAGKGIGNVLAPGGEGFDRV